MKKILEFLNPFAHLGEKKYSVFFALFTTIGVSILSEFIAYKIFHDPDAVGMYIIFINVALIIYFAFRDGIKGGRTAVMITILYYLYIIATREYQDDQLRAALETTAVLTFIYGLLALTIGWLKQKLDDLIHREKESTYRAEEDKLRLETILEQLPVGVLLVNVSNARMIGNKQMEKIMGGKIPAFLRLSDDYRSPFAHKNKKSLAPKEWPIVRALKKGEVVAGEEMELLRRDKKRIFVRVNAAPIKNKKNEVIAAVSTTYDITQEKGLEQRKNDFVNMASHELKTPITSMKLYIEFLLRRVQKFDDSTVTKTVNNIKVQTERLQELINDLLDVSRIQTGKLHFTKEKFNIVDHIQETIEVLAGSTKKQKIIFKNTKPITVYADRFRIYQVVTNLITNAIKYSPENTTIIVRVQQKKGEVVVSVQDFGIGLEKTQYKKIFERLFQVSDSTEKSYPGLGMGLYISKEIMRRHKGKIWVEAEKGKGSTFFFSLPA